MVIPKDLLPLETRENTLKKVSEVISRFAEKGVPLLDPEEDLKVLLQIQFYVSMCVYIMQLRPALLFSDSKWLIQKSIS